MSDTRDRYRTLLVLTLLCRSGGQALRKEIKPEPDAADVGHLTREGLIEVGKQGRAHLYMLTEKGWAHAAASFGDPLPETKFAAGVLRDLLIRLKAYMERSGVGLAELLASAPPPPDGKDLPDRIRAAYLKIGGRFSTRVPLAALRAAVRVDRDTLDQTLLDMMRRGDVALYALAYRPEITAADEAAALEVGGEPKHTLYMDR